MKEGTDSFLPSSFIRIFYALQRHESPSTGQKFRFHDSLLAAGKPQIPERLISSVLFGRTAVFFFPIKYEVQDIKLLFSIFFPGMI